ncbi:hypothetical protein P4132_23760, partial [Pseudomonas aeruginosa]|nr:hypothetical protein [Pseudomonas aeruginosa]
GEQQLTSPLSGAGSAQAGSLRAVGAPPTLRTPAHGLLLQLVYDRAWSCRAMRELYHVDGSSGPLVARLDRRRPDLYLLPLDHSGSTATCWRFTLVLGCAPGHPRPVVGRGAGLVIGRHGMNGPLQRLAGTRPSSATAVGATAPARQPARAGRPFSPSTGWKTCRAGGERRRAGSAGPKSGIFESRAHQLISA